MSAQAGDIYRMRDLFRASAPAGQLLIGYRVALNGSGGQLLLNDQDVSNRNSFSAEEFARLGFVAGGQGSQQSLTVVAQAGRRLRNGTLSPVADSQVVQINATVTGTRSINAMNALVSQASGPDADLIAMVKEANILTGTSVAGRPQLSTGGNFTARPGDSYRMGDLFKASAPAGQSLFGYHVALTGSGGQLLLNGQDVSGRSSFSAEEFAHLSFVAGAQDSQQSLTVVAQAAKRLRNGTFGAVADSQAVQINAAVTGTRSINAMNALATQSLGSDSGLIAMVKEANILTGTSAGSRTTLGTTGNFTAQADDTYRISDLFKATAPSGQSLIGYRVALNGTGGQLLLDGEDVSSRSSFTAEEVAHLSFVAGAQDSQQSLTVVAQAGKRLRDGPSGPVADSLAVQITAAVTGTRSINAMAALVTQPSESDAGLIAAVKEANILTGTGAASRPVLATGGNFTAQAAESYRMSDLFKATAPSGQSLIGYLVALDGGGGQLLLNGQDVSSRSRFTAAEFAHLTFVAGAQDSQQNLTVVAQAGKRLSNGSVSGAVDSQALQISVTVTGTRSINAMNALATQSADADAGLIAVVKEANILTGTSASNRPSVQTEVSPVLPMAIAALATRTGNYMTSGAVGTAAPTDLSAYDPRAIGSSAATGTFANPANSLTASLLLLRDAAEGAFRSSGWTGSQSTAVKAYSSAG
ncbi:MAG: hypothetical protein JSS43_31970 [Proteobacteria bacterium]|nr:hypothetical protein [Pseudomonadota bacterium]